MDTSTYEILKECNSGCRMAVNSIEQLTAYLKNQELQELFSKYKEDYEKMERESIRLSEGKLQEEKFSEKAAETFAWISAEVKMMFNDDTSKIAEMMIDGANMGIKSILVCSFVKFSDVYRSDMVVDMGYVFWIIYFVYSGEAYGGYVRYRNLIVGTYVGRLERNKSCTIYNRFVYRTRKR